MTNTPQSTPSALVYVRLLFLIALLLFLLLPEYIVSVPYASAP